MCTEILFQDGARGEDPVDTLAALCTALRCAPEAVVLRQRPDGSTWVAQPHECLCPVDVPATLAAHGFDVSPGFETHGVEFLATRRR